MSLISGKTTLRSLSAWQAFCFRTTCQRQNLKALGDYKGSILHAQPSRPWVPECPSLFILYHVSQPTLFSINALPLHLVHSLIMLL